MLFGFIIWFVPFVLAFFVWDSDIIVYNSSEQTISVSFVIVLLIVLAIVLNFYFANYKETIDSKKLKLYNNFWDIRSLKTGLIWYVEIAFLSMIFFLYTPYMNKDYGAFLIFLAIYMVVPLITSMTGSNILRNSVSK